MRVALDATPVLGQPTGIGVFVGNVLPLLARRPDLELVAYAATWRRHGQLGPLLPPGTRSVRAPMVAGVLHEAWLRADVPAIELWTGSVDVVHGTNYVVPPARRAAEVVSVHDLSFVHYPELCERQSLRFPGLIRRALRRGAFVHALSEWVADEIRHVFGAPADRVRVVPLAVGHAVGDALGAAVSQAVGEPRDGGPVATDDPASPRPPGPSGDGRPDEGRPYVLALARSEPRKDLPLLVAAFDAVAAHHPDVDLVLAGPAGWAEGELEAAIRQARHRDRIRRLGWVPDAERAALLRAATVLVYPSRYEGFGLPPLEAMTAGVPVVTTAAGAIPEVVGDAASLVPVGDEDALAGAVDHLLGDEAARQRLVVAGRARAARFSWQRCADGLYDLYADAAASRS